MKVGEVVWHGEEGHALVGEMERKRREQPRKHPRPECQYLAETRGSRLYFAAASSRAYPPPLRHCLSNLDLLVFLVLHLCLDLLVLNLDLDLFVLNLDLNLDLLVLYLNLDLLVLNLDLDPSFPTLTSTSSLSPSTSTSTSLTPIRPRRLPQPHPRSLPGSRPP
jgi:hypothetical protein